MISIDYDFGIEDYPEEITLELDNYDLEEFKDYFINANKNKAQEIVRELYSSAPETDKQWAKDEWDISSANDIYYTTEKGKDFINAAFEELVDEDYLKDKLYDEMYEYFMPVAEERLEDEKEYRKDPLGYYGMSWSDFI